MPIHLCKCSYAHNSKIWGKSLVRGQKTQIMMEKHTTVSTLMFCLINFFRQLNIGSILCSSFFLNLAICSLSLIRFLILFLYLIMTFLKNLNHLFNFYTSTKALIGFLFFFYYILEMIFCYNY